LIAKTTALVSVSDLNLDAAYAQPYGGLFGDYT